MLSHLKSYPGRVLAVLPAMSALLFIIATFAAAQDQAPPKWELYGGYSLLYPNTDVHGLRPGALLPVSSVLETNPKGVGLSGTYNFNRWLGLTVDGSNHWGSGESQLFNRIDDTRFDNISLGPKLTFRSAHFSPFLEVLAGDHRLVPEAFHSVDKLGLMFGGGLDINLSKHVAWRLLRADYVMSGYRYGPSSVPTTDLRGVRLQSGLVFMFGGKEPAAQVAASCSVNPTEVTAGEPVTATVTTSNFNPNHSETYNWTSTGGKVSGKDTTATIDTTGVAGGNYTVNARVSDPKRKQNGEASCSSNFSVREPRMNPPTISCVADPSTVQPGGTSTITSSASSPDGRTLTYSYSSSAGSVSGTSQKATLNTAGASPGPITITCNTRDDRSLTAAATTTVTVEAPPTPAPPPPQGSKINQIDFPNPQKPWRVDNTAKAILDDVALRLQREPDSRLVIIGSQEPTETRNNLAAERAVDAKFYLTNDKGVDPSRIETRSGGTAGKVAEFWIIPAGASYTGNEPAVDENRIKAIPDHPRRK
jgi:outer membrane protein OmpA-like peptidoglycan-associated protein